MTTHLVQCYTLGLFTCWLSNNDIVMFVQHLCALHLFLCKLCEKLTSFWRLCCLTCNIFRVGIVVIMQREGKELVILMDDKTLACGGMRKH